MIRTTVNLAKILLLGFQFLTIALPVYAAMAVPQAALLLKAALLVGASGRLVGASRPRHICAREVASSAGPEELSSVKTTP
jgi:hypothetical protein